VASPNKIDPRTDRINSANGIKEVSSCKKIILVEGTSSSKGFGAILGLKYARPTT